VQQDAGIVGVPGRGVMQAAGERRCEGQRQLPRPAAVQPPRPCNRCSLLRAASGTRRCIDRFIAHSEAGLQRALRSSRTFVLSTIWLSSTTSGSQTCIASGIHQRGRALAAPTHCGWGFALAGPASPPHLAQQPCRRARRRNHVVLELQHAPRQSRHHNGPVLLCEHQGPGQASLGGLRRPGGHGGGQAQVLGLLLVSQSK
jgi:hypothetical protein